MTDWQGIATLVAAIFTGIVSVIAAIASLRNGTRISEVHKAVNGTAEDAHAAAAIAARAAMASAINAKALKDLARSKPKDVGDGPKP